MTRAEFSKAWTIAQSHEDLSGENYDPAFGYGLPGFKPVGLTLKAVARLLRYQCTYIFGNGYDAEELENNRRLMTGHSARILII